MKSGELFTKKHYPHLDGKREKRVERIFEQLLLSELEQIWFWILGGIIALLIACVWIIIYD